MRPILFKNARIIDPSCQMDEIGSLFIKDKKIEAIGPNLEINNYPEEVKIIDCQGKVLFPGLVDMRVFIDDLFTDQGENLETASKAAAAGGITSFLLLPSERVLLDNQTILTAVQNIRSNCDVKIYPGAAISKALKGIELTEVGFLKEKGALALSEGKQTIKSSSFLYKAMLYAKNFDLLFCHETQDYELTQLGLVQESLLADWMGVPTIINEAEAIALARDLYLAQHTKIRYHATQISTKKSIELLKEAKKNLNTKITASVSLYHLLFNDYDIKNYNTNFLFLPPLRSEDERLALIEAVKDGSIDAITAAHEPLSARAKEQVFEMAPYGVAGLEISFAAALQLYHNGTLPLMRIIELLSTKPAQILGLEAGTLQKGRAADFVLADLDEIWTFNTENSYSRAKSSAFTQTILQGRVQQTFVDGKTVFDINFHKTL